MSLARHEPSSPLRRMWEEMDRMFGNMWVPPMLATWIPETMAPPIDVFERDNNLIVKANLPGLTKDDIQVTATDDSISLKGEFKHEEETKEKGFVRHERQEGKFFRTIPMPIAIKADQVKATFKDGVLEITAPRAEEEQAKEKKVEVQS